MVLKKLQKNHNYIKYTLISVIALCTIFSDFLIQQRNLSFQLTFSSIFLFIIIGLTSNNISLLIITLLNCILFGINGFNILSLIQALEIYYVWLFYKNNKKNILLNVLVFWILLALPSILIFSYTSHVTLSIESLFFILLIFLNRIFNALISKIFLDYIPFEPIIGMSNGRTKNVTLSNLLFDVGIATIVVPVILFSLATNSNTQKQISEVAVEDLKSASEYVNQEVDSWTEEEKINLKLKNPIQMYVLVDILKMYVSTSNKSINYYLVDYNNKVIASDSTVNYMKDGLEWLKEGSLSEINPNIYKWTANRENAFIIKNYSKGNAYFYVTTISRFKVIISVPGEAYASKSIDFYLNLLKLLLPISLFIGVFFIMLKRLMINSISKLINITNGLPEKLDKNETVIFEKSNVAEIDSLIVNFQMMVDNLSSMILNVEATNKKLQKSERKLFDQAHFDSLTGLPNRHYFIKYVQEVMKNFYTNEIYSDKNGIAFFFIDLDKFKIVNDTYGHSTGDKLLKEVANIMNNILQTYDSSCTFIARLGGDEFVVEFIYEDKDEIIELANNIIDALKRPIIIDNNELVTGSSIGISLFPEDGKDIDGIFIKSDASMYKAKYSGGNTFLFYS